VESILSEIFSVTQRSAGRETVVAIQPHGSGIPIFLVTPGLEGVSIVRHLGSDQPVFAMRVPEFGDTNPRLEEIAAVLAQHIRRVRPKGPYAVAGWCAAGILGLEIARHLEMDGEPVAFAALLDARRVFLGHLNPLRRTWICSWLYAKRVQFFVQRVAKLGLKPVKMAVGGRANGLREATRRMREGAPDLIAASMNSYVPTRWSGRVVHIWAEERPRGRYCDPQFAWDAVSPRGFAFYEVPGDHLSMLEEPAVGRIAMVLDQELRRAKMPSTKKVRKTISS
jgi:thioesterase domain-containing protein